MLAAMTRGTADKPTNAPSACAWRPTGALIEYFPIWFGGAGVFVRVVVSRRLRGARGTMAALSASARQAVSPAASTRARLRRSAALPDGERQHHITRKLLVLSIRDTLAAADAASGNASANQWHYNRSNGVAHNNSVNRDSTQPRGAGTWQQCYLRSYYRAL